MLRATTVHVRPPSVAELERRPNNSALAIEALLRRPVSVRARYGCQQGCSADAAVARVSLD